MIRPVTAEDLPLLHAMVQGMAENEEATAQISTDEDELRRALFGPEPLAHAHFAVDDKTGEIVGYTLWCLVYSTWRGTAIHIDDIYIRQDAVGRGFDTALLSALAAVCAERGYRHMQWWGRVTNEPIAAFYRSLGAEIPSVQGKELTVFRLSGTPLADLARQA
ncbi:GNAT family N-acetyltransferase [Streptomyces sp. NPDC001480]|uniref:GNAT family N-acetyltransferase n=1 Tax=Streptomyces sp. NPDC001480 TaxID=3364577 RepID=UPI0036B8AABE